MSNEGAKQKEENRISWHFITYRDSCETNELIKY